MIKYSIVLLLYNSDLKKIKLTLKSVMKQNFDRNEIEIIIADDGSDILLHNEIKNYLEKESFYQYKMTLPKENVGTVKNILDGLNLCSGKYVKLIGAGDLLFSMETLKSVYEFMEQNQCVMSFGLMKGYHYDNNRGLIIEEFRAPKDINVYKKEDYKKIKQNIIVFGDWISGASMFFELDTLKLYLKKMENIVIYCEDLITANLVLDKQKISFLDKTLIWYEIGTGITTTQENKNPFLKKIYKDHEQCYKNLMMEYPEENGLIKGLQMMKLSRGGRKKKLLRNLLEPSRIAFAIRINIQKLKRSHWKNEEGFLNCNNIEE